MAQIPTSEEIGKAILKIFGKRGIRPGEMLLLNLIKSQIIHYGCREDDVDSGLQWLLDNGYIEQRNGRSDILYLTESGYSLI